MNKREPDLSSLLPDDDTLKARREVLVDAVGEPTAGTARGAMRRRGPRIAAGAAFALVAVAAALIFSAGGDNPPQAFAVETRDGGGVTIKVYSLEDAEGLEGALADAGIPSQVSWLPAGMTCREPHFTPSEVKNAMGGTIGGASGGGPGEALKIGVMSAKQFRERRQGYMRGDISADEYYGSTGNISLDPAEFSPDQSVVISGSPGPYKGDPEGGHVFQFGIAAGPVEPCEPVSAPPSGNDPFGHPSPGGGPGYVPNGDAALSQSAIATDLRAAAEAAEASDTRVEAPPEPGQFLFTKTEVVQLQGWEPDGRGAGLRAKPRHFTTNLLGPEGNALPALVPTLNEVWTAPDGRTRERETLGQIAFLSDADQGLWEEAGSPPPFAFDPDEHDVQRNGSGASVKEYASKDWRGRRAFDYVDKLAQLPTDPEALRLAIENRGGESPPVDPSPADSVRGGATIATLLEILGEPIASPALRAAAFGALAEVPGIGFERDVADGAGRRGDAISWAREGGFGRRFIFDPRTSEILAEAEVIFDAKAAEYPGVPDGTVFRETAYLKSEIVEVAP